MPIFSKNNILLCSWVLINIFFSYQCIPLFNNPSVKIRSIKWKQSILSISIVSLYRPWGNNLIFISPFLPKTSTRTRRRTKLRSSSTRSSSTKLSKQKRIKSECSNQRKIWNIQIKSGHRNIILIRRNNSDGSQRDKLCSWVIQHIIIPTIKIISHYKGRINIPVSSRRNPISTRMYFPDHSIRTISIGIKVINSTITTLSSSKNSCSTSLSTRLSIKTRSGIPYGQDSPFKSRKCPIIGCRILHYIPICTDKRKKTRKKCQQKC